MTLFDEILAQDGPLSTLKRALQSRRVAQAYLFEGPGGVGKKKTALALASTMLCIENQTGCGRCNNCRRIANRTHPDVRVFEPRSEGNRNIQVDFVRDEILPFARFAPFEGACAFVIFPQADVSFPAQHAEAANALLKTLEEPRANLHFLLLAERPDRLLATIRSRCQRVRFGRLPAKVIDAILAREAATDSARQAAKALACGRADRALELSQGEKAEKLLEHSLRIDATVDAAKPGELIDRAEELARSDDLVLVLETLALFYRDVAAAALGLSIKEISFGHLYDLAKKRAQQLGASSAARRVDLIYRTCENIERNANKELCLDALLFDLGSASSLGRVSESL
ncbi:MAG: hypothetical protein JXA30_19630 [Deltaproteobacteria bacterium]|nr:hypothetical protein [Deltaproteobacteria bacterium]